MFLFVTLTSCQKEDLSSLSAQEDSSQSKIEVKELFADDITNHYFLQKNLSGLYPPNLQDGPFPNTFPENQVYSAEIISFNDFIVKEDYAIEIDMEYMTTYTFNVEDSRGLLESDFANLLIIEEKGAEKIFNLFVQYYNWMEYKENNEAGLLYSYHLIMEGGEFYPPLHETQTQSIYWPCNFLDPGCSMLGDNVVLIGTDNGMGGDHYPDEWDHGVGGEEEMKRELDRPFHGGAAATEPIDKNPDPEKEAETPCDLIEDILNNEDIVGGLKSLFSKLDEDNENGFVADKTSNGHRMRRSAVSASNTIEWSIFASTYGLYHTHPNGLLPIFSPQDFLAFMHLILNSEQPIGNLHLVVIGEDGESYMMSYDGSRDDFDNMGNPFKHGSSDLGDMNAADLPRVDDFLNKAIIEDELSYIDAFVDVLNKEYLNEEFQDLGFSITELILSENGTLIDGIPYSIDENGKSEKEDNCN